MAISNPQRFFHGVIGIVLLVTLPVPGAAQGITLTMSNSSSGSPPHWNVPNSISSQGIIVRPIASAFVLNASSGALPAHRSPALSAIFSNGNKWTVVNGTFSYWPIYQGHRTHFPTGMIIRGDRLEAPEACSSNAGAVVIKDRGRTVIVARSGARNLNEAHARFGTGIDGFMGCGVLLIENGRKLNSPDLAAQGFSFDLDNHSCRGAQHTLIGIRDGVAYALFNPGQLLSCRYYRDLLHANGFGSLVKFDGSSGFFYKDSAASEGHGGSNPTGFFIQEW